MRSGLEEEMMTEAAPFSSRASAMPKPIPEVPPMMRIRLSWSLEVYLLGSDGGIVGESANNERVS